MIAISKTPLFAPDLLKWMQNIQVPQEILYRLMRQKEYNDNADYDVLEDTALMMVIKEQPSLMPHLLVSMRHIHSAHLSILLQQTNKNNENIVMMELANNNPLLLSQLLQFMADMRLNTSVLCGLLSERNIEGKTAYMMALSMMPSTERDRLVQLIHQCALHVILLIMINESAEFNAGTVQRREPFDRLIEKLLQCVVENDTAALKEKFKQYAVMAVQITTPSSLSLFSNRGSKNRASKKINSTPLMALDFFADESLVRAVTGGYANSSMLLAELTEASDDDNDIECVAPPKKVRRNLK